MFARSLCLILVGSVIGFIAPVAAQAQSPMTGTVPAAPSQYKIISPAAPPAISPGQVTLLELEGKFSEAVAEGGGKAFAAWFADDAVTLNNGQPATVGRGAIAASAIWDPKEYTLTWVAQGAQMGPSNDMGFTWGHYEGRFTGKDGQPVIKTGRYITVWKKLANGSWKVAMDASADEPPPAAACCNQPGN